MSETKVPDVPLDRVFWSVRDQAWLDKRFNDDDVEFVRAEDDKGLFRIARAVARRDLAARVLESIDGSEGFESLIAELEKLADA